jgi:hypothetical protein
MCDQAAPVPGVFVQPSRPYLEWHVRTRVRALPNVEIAEITTLRRLVDDGTSVTQAARTLKISRSTHTPRSPAHADL